MPSSRRGRSILVGLGLGLVVAGLAVTGWRVRALEGARLERLSEWSRLGDGGRALTLLRAPLQRGALVTVEVCALDPLEPARWADAVELTLRPAVGDALVTLPLTEGVLSYATRTPRAACLLLAYDEPVLVNGEHLVEARPTATPLPEQVARAPLRARLVARGAVGWIERALLLALLVGALLALAGAVERAPAEDRRTPSRPLLRVGLGVAGLVAGAALLAKIPGEAPSLALLRGVAIGLVQVALAYALIGRERGRGERLAVVLPRRGWLVLGLAPVVGGALWLAGHGLSAVVPSTGVAPIQAEVSSPAGFLTVAALAVVAPLAEELFFRGFLFGTLASRFGNAAAFALTALLFLLAHLQQVWGAWGALSALLVTALVLTGLRWWSGSLLAPMLAHLAHNGVLLALSLSALAGE